MISRLWRTFWPLAEDVDGGWLRRHSNAEIVSEERLDRGWKRVVRAGNEQRTYLQDDNGNVVAVLP